jgi:flagellar protein FliT
MRNGGGMFRRAIVAIRLTVQKRQRKAIEAYHFGNPKARPAKKSVYFQFFLKKSLKFAESLPLTRTSGNLFLFLAMGASMNATEVLTTYESIAGLTSKMAAAARSGDFETLASLEQQCAAQAGKITAGPVAPLSGAPRMRKIDLLKQMLADDRAIRDVTEPWMARHSAIMEGRLPA